MLVFGVLYGGGRIVRGTGLSRHLSTGSLHSAKLTSSKTEAMRSVRFVWQSVCVQDYCKGNQSISLKLGDTIGHRPTNRQNWLTFGGDAVSHTDSESLFHFPHHYGIGDFRIFISISHTVTGRFSQHSAKWFHILAAIRQTSGSAWIGINSEISIRISNHFWLRFWPSRRFTLSE